MSASAIPHRSAVTADGGVLIHRTGIPEVVCMKISGHKTRAAFDRYNIVSERDLADVAKKLGISHSLAKVEQVAAKFDADEHATIQ